MQLIKPIERKFQDRHIPKGHYIRFAHERDCDNVIFKTTCTMYIEGDDSMIVVAFGMSRVNPNDNPCKKIGRAISRGRMLKGYYYPETIK